MPSDRNPSSSWASNRHEPTKRFCAMRSQFIAARNCHELPNYSRAVQVWEEFTSGRQVCRGRVSRTYEKTADRPSIGRSLAECSWWASDWIFVLPISASPSSVVTDAAVQLGTCQSTLSLRCHRTTLLLLL